MQKLDTILINELEQLLEQVAPREIDLAASYVTNSKDYDREVSGESAFGTPGGGILSLVGPVLLHFLALVALDVVASARKKGADFAVSKITKYLTSKFRKALPETTSSKEDAMASIVQVLRQAGWETSRATTAAGLVWDHGTKSAQLISELKQDE